MRLGTRQDQYPAMKSILEQLTTLQVARRFAKPRRRFAKFEHFRLN